VVVIGCSRLSPSRPVGNDSLPFVPKRDAETDAEVVALPAVSAGCSEESVDIQ
jgi:hypothetical protein